MLWISHGLLGLLGSEPVRVAAVVGAVAALSSAVVGVFTVIRGQAFAGHALGDLAATGGSGAFLLGLSQLWGFIAFSIGAALFMELAGVQRRRGRDVVTGVVQGAGLGVAALFLYFAATTTTTGATFTILFGSMFVLDPASIPPLAAAGGLALLTVLVLSRALLLSSLSPELAAAHGVRVRAVGTAYLVALAVSVALSAVAIGAILSTALLIGPPAAALRVARGPAQAMATAAAIGVGVTWLGIALAYASYGWPPQGHGWPVSFLVVALVVACYFLTHLPRRRWQRPASGTGERCSPA